MEFSCCDLIRMLVTEVMGCETLNKMVVVVCGYVGGGRWNVYETGIQDEEELGPAI